VYEWTLLKNAFFNVRVHFVGADPIQEFLLGRKCFEKIVAIWKKKNNGKQFTINARLWVFLFAESFWPFVRNIA